MSTQEQVYALLVEANPVPDPDALPASLTDAHPRLRVIEARRSDMQTQTDIDVGEAGEQAPRRRRRGVWAFAATALVAVLLGATAWMIWGGKGGPWTDEPDHPTVVFDGEMAAYRGPASLEKGRFTVSFENDYDGTALLGYEVHNRNDVTMDEAQAWYREYGDGRPPPWQTEFFGITGAAPGLTGEDDVYLFDGRYLLYVWLEDSHRVVPAAIVEVTPDGIDITTD